jgi:hypothetical protein
MAPMSDSNDSIPHLFGNAIDQLGKLLHNEVQLAKAEVSEKIALIGKGAALVAAAAVMCIPTVVMVLITLAQFLVLQGMSPLAAYLISTGVGLVATIVLAMTGMSCFKAENLKLKITTQQLDRDLATAKELTK